MEFISNKTILYAILFLSGLLFGVGYLCLMIYYIIKRKYHLSLSFLLGPISIFLVLFIFKDEDAARKSILITSGFLMFIILLIFIGYNLYLIIKYLALGQLLV